MYSTFWNHCCVLKGNQVVNNESLLPLVQVMSLSFVIGAFSSVQSTKLRKELNYALLAKVGVISSLLSGVIGISLAFYGTGVWSLVAQNLSQGILYTIVIWSATTWKPSFNFSWKALMQLWGFGFRMFLVGLLDAIYTRLDYIIIGRIFSPATLGFYQRAKSLNIMAVQYSSGSLMSVLFPILSQIQNDLLRFQNVIIKSFALLCFIVFLLFGSLYFISEELIVVLFSDKWLPSVEYFKILTLSGFAYPLNALLVNVLSSRGNSKAFLRMAIYKKSVAFLNFGVGFLFGIEGFLYGLIVVATINTSISIIMASREANIPIIKFYKPIITQVSIAAVTLLSALLAVEFLPNSAIILLLSKLTLFATGYITLNYLFKTISFQYFLEQFRYLHL